MNELINDTGCFKMDTSWIVRKCSFFELRSEKKKSGNLGEEISMENDGK